MAEKLRNLHKHLLEKQDAYEERVEVNQRHLIDKILARYSAEFTVFRELIQNSNDAGASEVEIEFIDSKMAINEIDDPSIPLPNEVDTIIFRNNGRQFSDQDWTRLKRIAEGNPDVDKIGFFGVGFFSLFSLCEEPLVDSGGQSLGFYWRGDQLFTKRGKSEISSASSSWTTFYLSLRDPISVPAVDDFCKFLSMSLAFTADLKKIRVSANGMKMATINKKPSPGRPLDVLRTLPFVKTSPNKIFQLESAELSHIQLEISQLVTSVSLTKALWSMIRGTQNQKREYENFSVFMRYARGKVKVSLPKKYIKDMERTTKKIPPETTLIHMIYTGYEDYEMTNELCRKNPRFKDLAPFPDQGRVYIGFPTHQTTGASAHIQAHLIPTVERESIDFNDRTLNLWNTELLTVCGVLCRIVYEDEFSRINDLYKLRTEKESDMPNSDLIRLSKHMMNVFVFRQSTPATVVSRLLHDSFHNCLSVAVSFLSSKGILPATKVRIPDLAVAKFSRKIAVVPEDILKGCDYFISDLQNAGIILPITLTDILEELQERLLTEEETISMLKWWIATGGIRLHSEKSGSQVVKNFLQTALVPGCGVDKAPVPLNQISTFASILMVPPSVPTPLHCLPSSISRNFGENDLIVNLGLSKLDILTWIEYVAELKEFELVAPFAESILEIIARLFSQIPSRDKAVIISLLQTKKCILTSDKVQPMHLPQETYLKNVTLFADLPIIQYTSRSLSESFLRELGVRTHVELQLVFDRLDGLDWDEFQLVKYLSSVSDKLSLVEMNRLRETPLFTAQPRIKDENIKQVKFNENVNKKTFEREEDIRYIASQLYAPTKDTHDLNLPILTWPSGKWKFSSPEAKFLSSIGLQSIIALPDLITICADSNEQRSAKALMYLCEKFDEYYLKDYHPAKVVTPFVPIEGSKEKARPSECFRNPACKLMSFKVLRQDLLPHADKFGVLENPTSSKLLEMLFLNKPSIQNAPEIFAFIGTQASNFKSFEWKELLETPFIPVVKAVHGKPEPQWMCPYQVFFKTENSPSYDGVFEYVDFGIGNSFLKACGVKEEPSPSQLCDEVLADPAKFLTSVGLERYLEILRRISLSYQTIASQSKYLVNQMREKAFLIAFVLGQDGENLKPILQKAADIVLIDDTILRRTFNPPSAPMENILEDFYKLLGSQRLSLLVELTYELKGGPISNTKSTKLELLVKERAPLLINEPGLKKDAKDLKLLSKIRVLLVEEIKMNQKFRGKIESRTATAGPGKQVAEEFTLMIIEDFDYFDVASVICRKFFPAARLNDVLLISTLLSTPLINLRDRGFPVDRLINMKAIEKELKNQNSDFGTLKAMFPNVTDSMIKNTLNGSKSLDEAAEKLLQSVPHEKLKDLPALPSRIEEKTPQTIEKNGTPPYSSSSSSYNGERRPSLFEKIFKRNPEATRKSFDVLAKNEKNEEDDLSITKLDVSDEKEQLKSIVNKCGENKSNWVYSENRVVPNNNFLESCTVHHAIDLRKLEQPLQIGDVKIPFYVGTPLFEEKLQSVIYAFKSSEKMILHANLMAFCSVLIHLATVFDLSMKSIHVFYPEKSKNNVIAFFRNGSLFFNYRHFLSSVSETESYKMVNNSILEPHQIPKEKFHFWYMVFCHELAHGFESAHDSRHEWYLSSFAEKYMSKFMALLNQ